MAKKVWEVKCPGCQRKWSYRDDKLIAGPMYKYCKPCAKIEADTGRSALRGSTGPKQPRWSTDDRHK